MKTYNVTITILAVPEDKFDDEMVAIEMFVRERGMSVQFGIGLENEDNNTDEEEKHEKSHEA